MSALFEYIQHTLKRFTSYGENNIVYCSLLKYISMCDFNIFQCVYKDTFIDTMYSYNVQHVRHNYIIQFELKVKEKNFHICILVLLLGPFV